MSAIDALTKSIATTATGYAAVINGALDMTTTSDSRRLAAMKGLANGGVPALLVVLTDCNNPDCDCMEKSFLGTFLGSRIVPVKVEVSE